MRLTRLGRLAMCLAFAVVLLPSWAAWPDDVNMEGVAPSSPQINAVSSATRLLFPDRPVRIGIITLPNTLFGKRAINETILRIQKVFEPYAVDAKVLRTEELEAGIRQGSIDVFIASAGFYHRMAKYGAISVGTLISKNSVDPNNAVAGAIVVRADSDYNSLMDLSGKKVSAFFPTAFIGVRTNLAEITKLGLDPEHFFSDVLYVGTADNRLVLDALDRHEVDGAMMSACWLESEPQEVQNRYRVINRQSEDVLHCQHSTRTYPNIMMAVTQGAPPGIAHIIAKTVLGMPKLSGGYHWGLATDMRSVDRLYRELRIENYAYLREWSVKRWIVAHWSWIAMMLLAIAGLIWHSYRVEVLVRKRTAELTRSMEEKREAQLKADALREKTEKLQKATIVGQLSNMIAHELTQPLATIKNYCEGQKAILESGDLDPGLIGTSREGIEKALARTVQIVNKVRSYGREGTQRDSTVNLEATLKGVVSGLSPELLCKTHLTVGGEAGLFVQADPLECQLLFNNLVKNALEAAVGCNDPWVKLSVQRKDNFVAVQIENSGLIIDEETLGRLKTPLITTKKAGCGLGISIAIALAEASGGRIDFARRQQGGLVVTVMLREAED